MQGNLCLGAAETVCRVLEEAGKPAYLVGGAVRDLLMGRTPQDWDVTTAALPEETMALFAHTEPTGLKHGTVTVIEDGVPVEVTTFRAEAGYSDGRHPDAVRFGTTLQEDLARRDFTVNAMALRPLDGTLADRFGGQRDLKEKLICCVGDPVCRFEEDSLRIFRAVRFSAQLDFAIEPETQNAIFLCAGRTKCLSGERVKAEMQKLLLSDFPERAELLLRCGALRPWGGGNAAADWKKLKEAPADPIHRWRVFCQITGFPADTLPMERALRRGILHPEDEVLRALTLTGGELYELGLRGPEISAAQRKLTAHVMLHPEDNKRETLLRLLNP